MRRSREEFGSAAYSYCFTLGKSWYEFGLTLYCYSVSEKRFRGSRSLMLDAYKVEEECLILSHFVYLQKNDHLTRYHDCQVEQAGSEFDRFIV